MKVWKLSPSTGWVRIRAATETRAREIAERAFANTKVAKTVHASDWAETDWRNPQQVACKFEDEDLSQEEGILGME